MNKDFFFGCKNENFQMKKLNIFQIFAKNIDYGYMLLRTKAKERQMCTLYYIKVECKGVYIAWTCFCDVWYLKCTQGAAHRLHSAAITKVYRDY